MHLIHAATQTDLDITLSQAHLGPSTGHVAEHGSTFILQGEDEDSIMTGMSVDTLIDQVRTLMVDSSRYAVRADFLRQLNRKNILTPWATTAQPYPPFLQTNHKLLTKIREVRYKAAATVQQLAATEFEHLAAKLEKEGETLISTLETMMQGKNALSLDERLSHAAAHVGKSKSTLQEKMENRMEFLAQRQPTAHDWDNFFRYCTAYRKKGKRQLLKSPWQIKRRLLEMKPERFKQ